MAVLQRVVVLLIAVQTASATTGKDLGCFTDQGDRAIKGSYTTDVRLTNDMCIDRCGRQGYKYAATQSGNQCFCGDEHNEYDRYGESEKCTTDCVGDVDQNCGGTLANHVFELDNQELDRLGCFLDNAVRALNGLEVKSTRMTNARCVSICRDQGFAYAGTQAGLYCFCGGEDYDKYGEQFGTECSSLCSGTNKEHCGGSLRNTVFKTGSKGAAAAPEVREVGCYYDTGDRALNNLYTYSDYMTNELCQQICAGEGTRYAATQAGYACFCGDSYYNKYGVVTGCTTACYGDATETCGGSSRNYVFDISSQAAYDPKAVELGCFKDTGDRAITGMYLSDSYMTNLVCAERCGRQGYHYSATQAGSYCFCGDNDDYDRFGEAVTCTYKCTGDNTQTCGGAWTNQIHRIENPLLNRVGCFQDTADRALHGMYYTSTRNTNERCINTCRNKGFAYAATQGGNQCHCGHDGYDKYAERTQYECNTVCHGFNKVACGGTWNSNVFLTGATKEKPAPDAELLGCFTDAGTRDLATLHVVSVEMTNEMCKRICDVEGTRYASTQAGQHCFCGNDYNMYGPSINCLYNCNGRPGEICGGSAANLVWDLASTGTPENCPAPEVCPEPEPAPEPEPCPEPEVCPEPEPAPEPEPCPEPEPNTAEPPKCARKRATFETYGLDIEPEFTDECMFEEKQCNEVLCYCVTQKTGEPKYNAVKIPVDEDFDCSRKPGKCELKRFKCILKDDDFVPECTASGKFQTKQCDESECWCVTTRKGRERSGTRTDDKNLQC